jgi:hypothetical protein
MGQRRNLIGGFDVERAENGEFDVDGTAKRKCERVNAREHVCTGPHKTAAATAVPSDHMRAGTVVGSRWLLRDGEQCTNTKAGIDLFRWKYESE